MLLTPGMRAYRPYGAALELLYAKDKEVLMCGPAGTGKSRAELEKLHICAEKYPGMRGLILRKTRASLSETGLVTFETKVVPEGHAILTGTQRKLRSSYIYPNGSEIIVAGLDKPEKVMSSEYDIAYIQEAIEVLENDWEMVTTRLRNGVMPYQQLIADTNPDRPTHWLKSRCDKGQTRIIHSRHEDNPVYWDREKNDWTPVGRSYVLGTLENLTGARRLRLRFGQWAAAEGAIYEDSWDAAVHLIDRTFSIPHDWPRLWVIDFGFVHPFVWGNWAIAPDGEMYLDQEIHMTKRLVEDHARRILTITQGQQRPMAVVCDHDAEDRATLEKHLGMETVGAKKTVSDGIQAVAARLRDRGNGKRGLYIFRDALDQIDTNLLDLSKPISTAAEFDGYVWDVTGGRRKGEQPLKQDDDGMDMTRYAVAQIDLKPRYSSALADLPDTSVRMKQIGIAVQTRERFQPR